MLMAFLKEDYHRSAEVHFEAGYVPADTDISAFEDALREIAVPIFNRPLADISIAELLLSMFSVTERFKMETRPELLLLQKTMVVIEGVARELADQVNIWMLARPLIKGWVTRHLGPVGKAEAIADELQLQLRDWMRLPEKIDGVLTRIEEGNVSFTSEPSRLPIVAGAIMTASGGGWLAWSAVQHASMLSWILATLLTAIGFLLTLTRS